MAGVNMFELFEKGDKLYGYCNGRFSDGDYDDKVCVDVRPTYAVFEYVDKPGAAVLNIGDCENLDRATVESWDRERVESWGVEDAEMQPR